MKKEYAKSIISIGHSEFGKWMGYKTKKTKYLLYLDTIMGNVCYSPSQTNIEKFFGDKRYCFIFIMSLSYLIGNTNKKTPKVILLTVILLIDYYGQDVRI